MKYVTVMSCNDTKDMAVVTCNDCISIVVEGTTEDFVGVTLKNLFTLPCLRLPQTGRLINAGGEYLRALRVKAYLHIQNNKLSYQCWRSAPSCLEG